MKERIYRPQIRLHYDVPDEKAIIEKIEQRNKALYKSVNEYIIHAVHAFREPEEGTGSGYSDIRENTAGERPSDYQGTVSDRSVQESDGPLDHAITDFLSEDF